MSRDPSPATQLKAARRELRDIKKEAETLREGLAAYRARATKAEQEVAEWKRRFDALLADRAGRGEGGAL